MCRVVLAALRVRNGGIPVQPRNGATRAEWIYACGVDVPVWYACTRAEWRDTYPPGCLLGATDGMEPLRFGSRRRLDRLRPVALS